MTTRACARTPSISSTTTRSGPGPATSRGRASRRVCGSARARRSPPGRHTACRSSCTLVAVASTSGDACGRAAAGARRSFRSCVREAGMTLGGPGAALTVILGGTLVAAGLVLLSRTIALLGRLGEGTLAPWDPTTKLVIAGPYRHVRNPMIVGVAMILLGEAAIFGSVGLLA